jgi:hypothetical protein
MYKFHVHYGFIIPLYHRDGVINILDVGDSLRDEMGHYPSDFPLSRRSFHQGGQHLGHKVKHEGGGVDLPASSPDKS